MGFAGFVSGDSFFYGEVLRVSYVPYGDEIGFYPHKILEVYVDEPLLGYDQRLYRGQILRLRMDFPQGISNSPLENMEIGGRYFFKATFYFMLGRMQIDSRVITKYINQIGDTDMWYIPVNPGETIDINSISGLSRQLEFAQHAQTSVYLRTTKDMTAMPYTQDGQGVITLRNGRLLNKDDYLYQRPVVVVHRHFAERQRVNVGDTITINVSDDQHLVYAPYYLLGNEGDTNPFTQRITRFGQLGVLSKPGADNFITLDLEIVGVYDLFRWQMVPHSWSSANKFMFVPNSLIPNDWGLKSAYFGDIPENYLPMAWFSFALAHPRDIPAFTWSVRDTLADMGFRVSFSGRDGSEFWPAADIVLNSALLNLIMFALVTFLILLLTVAMFFWQRHKEYAILRSIGCPGKNIFFQSMAAVLLFAIPSVLLGGTGGWFLASQLSQTAMEGFGQIITHSLGVVNPAQGRELVAYYMEASFAPIIWLPILMGIILGLILIFVIAANFLIGRLSVLEKLQGAP